jgi:DNA-binding PucR family transcriptional regulator
MLADSPVVTVHLPPELRGLAGGHEEILTSGGTVAEVLESAGRGYPDIARHLLASDGSLLPGLAVYLGGRSVSELQGLATPVELEELVSVVPTGSLRPASATDEGQVGPFHRVEHVLDPQPQFGIADDLELAVEEQRVGILLAGEQLEIGGKIGGESQVGLAFHPEDWAKRAISIGE